MYDIMLVDLGAHDDHLQQLVEQYPFAKVTRYFDSVLATAMRCAEKSRTSHFWLVLSCADGSRILGRKIKFIVGHKTTANLVTSCLFLLGIY